MEIRISKVRTVWSFLVGLCAIFLFVLHSTAVAQDEPPPEVKDKTVQTTPSDVLPGADSDPTNPVFLSVRQEYYNFENGRSSNVFIFRKDQVFLRNKGAISGKRGFITRVDVPLVFSKVNGESSGGLGDIYAQALWVPKLNRKFGLAVGTGLVVPTATGKTLGTGKVQIVPTVVPIWFFKRKGYFLVRAQDFISVAGSGSRPDIHATTIAPTFLWRLDKKWWVSPDTEFKVSWKNGRRAGFKSGLQIGRMLSPKVGIWIKPEITWGDYPGGGWALKSAVVWHKPK